MEPQTEDIIMPNVQVDNVDMHYTIHGEQGHPLVLVAGYTGDYLFFQDIIPLLSQHFKVLTFDNQGVGQTKDSGQPLNAKLMADNTVALFKKLNFTKPHLVGQSMGGTIAQTIASKYPDEISKLALLNTTAKWRNAMLQASESLIELREAEVDFDIQFNATLPWIFGDAFLADKTKVKALKDALLSAEYPQSLVDQKRQCEVLKNFDGRKLIQSISAETLVLYSTLDLLTLPNESEYLAEKISNSKLKAFLCGHDLPHELPNELGAELLRFFV